MGCGTKSRISLEKGQPFHILVPKFSCQQVIERKVIPNISTTQRYTSGNDQGKSWLVWGWRASTSILLLLLLVIVLVLLVILTKTTSATKEDQRQEAQETTTERQEMGCQGKHSFEIPF